MVFSSKRSLNWDMPVYGHDIVGGLGTFASTPVVLVHKPPTLAHGSPPSPPGSYTSFTSSFTPSRQD